MINENQLRLGNLVSAKGCIQVVTEIWEGGFSYEPLFGECADDKIEGNNPIPLTEEWLLKFGFNKGSILIDECSFLKINVENKRYSLLNEFGEYESHDNWITYVHQLQNLYFSLTGEELEIKQGVKLS